MGYRFLSTGILFAASFQVLSLLPAKLHASEAVHRLANSCYAIQSPATGKYLDKGPGLLIRDDFRYAFDSVPLANAGHFYFKAASLNEFLLTDRDGELLASRVPSLEVAVKQPDLHAEWNISARQTSDGPRFSFTNRFTGVQVRHNYTVTQKVWIFKYVVPKTETEFRLVAQQDCRPYPEISVAAWPAGQPQYAGDHDRMAARLKGDAHQPVRGYIDAHSHVMSHEFMGGKALHGDPFHRYGVEHALDDCDLDHGPEGRLDLIGGGGKAHDTTGWPAFNDWPAYNSKGHGGYYYKWMERAHLSGLRMVVVYLVENQVLCQVQSTVNPISLTGGNNSCDTMDSVFLQIEKLQGMIDYVDAQYGGPGKGFMRIVRSPAQARAAIAEGKLALLLGVEASEVLNCGERDYCDRNVVDNHLDALYDAGVRVMYPVHKFDNHFAGTSLQGGLVHFGQKLSTGHWFDTENCDDHTDAYDGQHVRGQLMESGIPGVPELPVQVVQNLIGNLGPQYPQGVEQCNAKGLTELGTYLVNRMIDKNMILDLDHLSARAATMVMNIVDARHYSGVVSTHGWMLMGKDGEGDTSTSDDPLHATFRRLIAAGGFIAPLNRDSGSLIGEVEEYLLAHVEAQHPGLSREQLLQRLRDMPIADLPGVGIGVDMGGLATMARPADKAPEYPFVNEFGIAFDHLGDGNGRRFNLADDGVAQYGMLADHMAQVREESGATGRSYVYDSVMNSAESYLRMWERAEARPPSTHQQP
jgi:microsomal dipeptidase-like Zn-dependent dipeptidase